MCLEMEKTLMTYLIEDRLIPLLAVYQHVPAQMLLPLKGLLTQIAFERPLVRVLYHMLRKIASGRERFITYVAIELPFAHVVRLLVT